MNIFARNCLRRGLQLFQTLMIFPLFLLLMLIPLEVALALHLFAGWLREQNWKIIGGGLEVLAVILALAVAVAIIRFLIFWLGYVVRTIGGSEPNTGPANS